MPVTERRVYSIAFTHDGDEISATVGERMTMRRRISRRSRRWRKYGENLDPPRYGAVVAAIFEGVPWFVWLDPREGTKGWANPLMAGNEISQIVEFK